MLKTFRAGPTAVKFSDTDVGSDVVEEIFEIRGVLTFNTVSVENCVDWVVVLFS